MGNPNPNAKWIVVGICVIVAIAVIVYFVTRTPDEEVVIYDFGVKTTPPYSPQKAPDAPPLTPAGPGPAPVAQTPSPQPGPSGFQPSGPAPVPGPSGFPPSGPASEPDAPPLFPSGLAPEPDAPPLFPSGPAPEPDAPPLFPSAPAPEPDAPPLFPSAPGPSGFQPSGPAPLPVSFGFQSIFVAGDNITDITAGIPGNSGPPQIIILKTDTGSENRARIVFEFNSSRSPNMSSLFSGETLPNPATTECYLRINGIHIIRVIYEGDDFELFTYGFYSDSFGNSITDGGTGTVRIKRIEIGTINIDRLSIRGAFTSVTTLEPTTSFEIRISNYNLNLYEKFAFIEFFTPPGNPSPVWYQDFLEQRFGSSIPNLTDSSLYTHVIVNDRYLFQIASDFVQGNTSIPIIHVDRLGAHVKNDFGIGFQIIALKVEFGNFTGQLNS